MPVLTTRQQPLAKLIDVESRSPHRSSFGELHQKMLEQYAPPSLVVNEEFDILHMSEKAGAFLEFTGGEPTKNLLNLIKTPLRLELRSALYQAVHLQAPVEARNIAFDKDGERQLVNIQVRPVTKEGDTSIGFILVLFDTNREVPDTETIVLSTDEPVSRQLEEELMQVKTQLKRSVEQHKYQEEELRASNEELQAMNEELRSATEELETSKEELQSINEELQTVNQELKVKIEETTVTSNNLQNLVNSADVATIFLDRSLKTRLYTPAALNIFNLIPSDHGRLISDITHRLEYRDLLRDAHDVLEKLTVIEREVTTTDNRVFMMRILPYRTREYRISGVVVTFFDITERKKAEERHAYLLKLSDALRPLVDAVEIKASAARLVGEYLGADRAYYVEISEAANEFVVARDWHRPGSPSHARRYSLEDWSMPWLINGETWVVRDTTSDPAMPDDQRKTYLENDIGAAVVVPLIKQGRLVATFATNQRLPRNWTQHEIAIVEETAERTWAAMERARAEEDLQRANAQMVDILESTTDAFYALDADFNFTYVNKKALQLWSRESDGLIGKHYWTEFPDAVNSSWYQKHLEVQEGGRLVHLETISPLTGTWIESSIYPSSNGGISVFFRDITGRKIAAERQAYLLKLSDTLRPLDNLEEVQFAAVSLLGEHLGVARALYGELDTDGNNIQVHRDYTNGVESMAGTFRITDFGSSLLDEYLAGRTVVVQDTEADNRLSAKERALYAHVNIRAFVCVPLVKGGRLFSVMAVNHPRSHEWTESAVSIIEETAHRASATVERAKAEENLRQSKRLQKALSIETVGVTYFTLEGGIHDANAAFERMSSFSKEEFATGKVVWKQLTPPEFMEVTMNARKEYKEAGQNTPYEKQYIRRDGSRWWGLCAGRRLSADEYVEFVLDITEQKKAEEALSRSEAGFRTVTNAIPQVIWANDENGRANYFNHRWYEYSGLSYDESYSRGWEAIVHPDDSPAAVEKWRSALAAGKIFDTEYRLKSKDGSYRWFIGRNVPLHDDTGKIMGWFGSATDINDLKNAEEAVRNTADRLQLALDAGRLGTFEFDFQTGAYVCTPQHKANFGYGEHDPVNLEILRARIVPADREYMDASFNQALTENNIYAVEYRTELPNGEVRWIRSVGRFVYNDSGEVQKMVGITLDITEQKLFTEELTRLVNERTIELQQSNEDLRQFAHVASHDLKEPVRKIKTFNNRLKDEFENLLPEKAKTYVNKIEASTDRMFSMIEGVLAYSLHTKADQPFAPIVLDKTIEEIESVLEVLINKKNAVITKTELPTIKGNPTLIFQLFYNLILNSLKFSKENEPAHVRVSSEVILFEDTEYVKISVEDNGIGFEAEFKDLIFQTFSRLNPLDAYEGTGLGLALCKKIVERHGGRIMATGELNMGAVFTMLFPLEIKIE